MNMLQIILLTLATITLFVLFVAPIAYADPGHADTESHLEQRTNTSSMPAAIGGFVIGLIVGVILVKFIFKPSSQQVTQ